MDLKAKAEQFANQIRSKSPQEIILAAASTFPKRITFATSLGEEDQIITDMIAKTMADISVFTLDTGRLFPQTYDLIAKTQRKYASLDFKVYYPDTTEVEKMVKTKGINLFYESVENRKSCCHVRKVEPLQRALKNNDAWIAGLRRDQAVSRTDLSVVEFDDVNQCIKINPLIDWNLTDVRAYIKDHHIDVNPLHEQGFISIGCAPCTRAIDSGEDIRAGRWWWEQAEQKECGLHNNPKWKKNKG